MENVFKINNKGAVTDFIHNDTSVTDIIIPYEINGVKVTTIYPDLFFCNNTITSVTIPAGTTSIGAGAFWACENLTKVEIPNTVTLIGLGAFDVCSKLIDVHYNGTEEQWNNIKIGNHNRFLRYANIHYCSNLFDINQKAISHYGERNQEDMCIEECFLLIQAINKKHRGLNHNIAEEIADVEIMLTQLKIINDCCEEVQKIKADKLQRLADRLRGEKNDK